MPKYHLLHDYSQRSDGPLGEFALHVYAEMNGNANFTAPNPVPPFPLVNLQTAANGFIAAVAVCDDGTSQDTLNKKTLRLALIALLDQLATYVELTAKNDPQIMASSGFNLASITAAKSAPVGTVAITSVTNPASGSLNLGLDMGPNVWGIETQVSSAPNVWVAAGYFTDPRNVTPANLTPGTMYAVRARVHGSFNQISDWSNPVSHMAM